MQEQVILSPVSGYDLKVIGNIAKLVSKIQKGNMYV